MAFGGENIDRTGEIRENNKGTLMKIISYHTCSDIQVEFLDGHHYITNTSYSNFKRGQVGNPYDITVNGIGYIGEGKYKTKKSPQRHTDTYNTYACSVSAPYEEQNKRDFVVREYGMPVKNIKFVRDKKDKIAFLKELAKETDESKIAIVEDTVSTLNQIYDNTNFITVHISSFFFYDYDIE